MALWLAIASGAVGLGCAWAAMVAGCRPTLSNNGHGAGESFPQRFLRSCRRWAHLDDITNYAVYGRLATLGLNPYLGSADELSHMCTTRSVLGTQVCGTTHHRSYGPVAAFWEYTTSPLVAGSSMRMFAVFRPRCVALVLFLASAWLLDRVVRDNATQRLRVAVLWTANPLLIYLLVNSAHVDVLAVFFGVAAITALRRSVVGAGVLAALATGTKVSLVFYSGGACCWALRKRARDLRVFIFAVVLTAVILVAPFVPEIYHPLSVAANVTSSHESPWHVTLAPLTSLLPTGVVHSLLTVGVWVLVALVAWRMSAVMPKPPVMATDVRLAGAWAATVLSLSWLLLHVLLRLVRRDGVGPARSDPSVTTRPGTPDQDHSRGACIGSWAGLSPHRRAGSAMTFVSNSVAPAVGVGLILVVVLGVTDCCFGYG